MNLQTFCQRAGLAAVMTAFGGYVVLAAWHPKPAHRPAARPVAATPPPLNISKAEPAPSPVLVAPVRLASLAPLAVAEAVAASLQTEAVAAPTAASAMALLSPGVQIPVPPARPGPVTAQLPVPSPGAPLSAPMGVVSVTAPLVPTAARPPHAVPVPPVPPPLRPPLRLGRHARPAARPPHAVAASATARPNAERARAPRNPVHAAAAAAGIALALPVTDPGTQPPWGGAVRAGPGLY